MKIYIAIFLISLNFSSLFATDEKSSESKLINSSLEELMQVESEIQAKLGSRGEERSPLEATSPIDVITHKQIERTGLNSLTDVLRYFVAGFNAPETSVADGSDHIRAYTLRGMSPDQILILVNGKRMHTSALLHVNGVIGRGSTQVDLETIAITAIEKIEILRDGAAAQYGSDAISGVINIILKGADQSNKISIHTGERKEGDGRELHADAFISIPLQYDGFVNISLDVKSQEATQRAGVDQRVSPASVTTHVGIPDATSLKALINTEIPLENDITLYGKMILSQRKSEASAFFRPVNEYSSSLYPNGFLPSIEAQIVDTSITVGASGVWSDSTSWELSHTYGHNSFDYSVYGSMNYSLGTSSPTSFDNGSLHFTQNITNFDIKKQLDSIKLAAGAEYKLEKYQVKAGDEASYIGTGSQGFTGFRPENEVHKDRDNYALYFDAIYDLNDDFKIEGAARYEDYSDFGFTTNVKLSMSYRLTSELLLRSSANSGFRAPSLAQSSFSHISSFVNTSGVLTTQGTFCPEHEVSQILGAHELKPEKSKNITLGSVYRPTNNLSLTLDYFFVEVDDRILLSSELSATDAKQQELLDKYGVSAARFFNNAASTETQGLDLKINYLYTIDKVSKINFGFWYNKNQTKVIECNSPSSQTLGCSEQINRVEKGQPKTSLKLLTNYQREKINITVNINYYGEYSQMMNGISYDFEPAWTSDIDISYQLDKDISISIGANNIFDTLPNTWDGLSGDFYGYDGIKAYSRYSPFGYSGAYYYFKASMKF